MSEACEIFVIGDVHGMWDDVDEAFLRAAAPAAAVFVGDFGEEDLALVQRIGRVEGVKGVMLGNHDAWYSMNGRDLTRLRAQLAALGPSSLAYSSLPLDGGSVALVGGRPFSWGGGWSRHGKLYRELFGLDGDAASAARIVAEADRHGGATIVLVGHNGPRGLGEGADAIYGCDFRSPHVDWGDADLALALAELRGARGRRVSATLAGHMHDELKGGGSRRRVVVENGTVHLNAAVVPRHREEAGATRRHFLRVQLVAGSVARAEDVWVGDGARVVARHPVYAAEAS